MVGVRKKSAQPIDRLSALDKAVGLALQRGTTHTLDAERNHFNDMEVCVPRWSRFRSVRPRTYPLCDFTFSPNSLSSILFNDESANVATHKYG